MATVAINKNNAFSQLHKRAYAANVGSKLPLGSVSNTADSPKTEKGFSSGTYLGVIQDFSVASGLLWAKIKLDKPLDVVVSRNFLGVKYQKFSDLWFLADYLTVDETEQPNVYAANGAPLSQNAYCTGNNVFLREKADRTAAYINTYDKADIVGKSDAVLVKGGTYSGGSTWYKIQTASGQTGYMASPFVSFRAPVSKPSTGSPAPQTKEIAPIEPIASPTESVFKWLLYGVLGCVFVFGVAQVVKSFKSPKTNGRNKSN